MFKPPEDIIALSETTKKNSISSPLPNYNFI